MGCTKCKDKKIVQKTKTQTKKVYKSKKDMWAGIIIFVWILLGIYGFFSIIKDIINFL